MTRNGKIARLPHHIREELNNRIRNGETAAELGEWLHEQEEVWAVLEEHDFDPINDQNISEWRLGGYQRWLENKEARDLVMELAVKSQDLGEATPEANLGVCVGNLLMVELIKMAKVLVQQEEDPHKRLKQLREVNLELTRLRWANTRDVRTEIVERRCAWAAEDREREAAAREKERLKEQQLKPYRVGLELSLEAQRLGGCAAAKRTAAHLLEVEHDLPKGRLAQQQNGVWMWEDDQWVWYVDRRKEGRGFVQEEWQRVEVEEAEETPKAKKQTSNTEEEVEGRGARGEGQKGDGELAMAEGLEGDEASTTKEDGQGSTESRPTEAEDEEMGGENGVIQGESNQFKALNE